MIKSRLNQVWNDQKWNQHRHSFVERDINIWHLSGSVETQIKTFKIHVGSLILSHLRGGVGRRLNLSCQLIWQNFQDLKKQSTEWYGICLCFCPIDASKTHLLFAMLVPIITPVMPPPARPADWFWCPSLPFSSCTVFVWKSMPIVVSTFSSKVFFK